MAIDLGPANTLSEERLSPTMFDLHPLDPRQARFKMIATLLLLSELRVIGERKADPERPCPSDRVRSVPSTRRARTGSRLVRPPRSC